MPSPRYPDHRPPAPRSGPGFIRIGLAIRWPTALAALLAGLDRLPATRARPASAAAAATAGPPPDSGVRSEAEASPARYREDDHWMHKFFATRSIGEITTRLCRDLGIAENTELWPAELIDLTQTPAEWSAAFYLLPPKSARSTCPPRAPGKPATIRASGVASVRIAKPAIYGRHQPP